MRVPINSIVGWPYWGTPHHTDDCAKHHQQIEVINQCGTKPHHCLFYTMSQDNKNVRKGMNVILEIVTSMTYVIVGQL